MSRSLVDRRCDGCGQAFSKPAPLRGPLPRYCSQGCKRKSDRPTGGDCQRCGSPFKMSSRGRRRKFCTLKCTVAASAQKRATSGVCGDCAGPCHQLAPRCKSCASRLKAEEQAAKLAGVRRACQWCGVEYQPVAESQAYCSKSCQNRLKCANRQSWRRGAERGESVRLIDVYQRDGGKCGVCGLAVDLSLKWPAPQCATLDHVVPISKGGPHTFSNIQVAHLACNASKNDAV